MKKLSALFAGLFVLLLPFGVAAFETRSGSYVDIPQGEMIDGTLYASGNVINVDGDINGDLICAGQNVNVRGRVAGSVLCAGSEVNLSGEVGDSARVAGSSVTANGKIGQNLMAFAGSVNVMPGADIGWDMFSGTGFLNMNGKIGRGLYGGAGQARIAGQVKNNVDLNLSGNDQQDSLIVADTARVGGRLGYSASKEGQVAPGAQIGGGVQFKKAEQNKQGSAAEFKEKKRNSSFNFFVDIYKLFAAVITALVLAFLVKKRKVMALAEPVFQRPWPALGWGFLVVVVAPFVFIALLISILGIPLALIGAVVLGVVTYLVKVAAGMALGWKFLAGKKKKEEKMDEEDHLMAALVGVALLWIVFAIPFIGWLASFLVTLWGLGALVVCKRQMCKNKIMKKEKK